MNKALLYRLTAWGTAILLLVFSPEYAKAESSLLPPSALLIRQSQTLMTGDYFVQEPDTSLNKMSAAEVDSLYKAMEAYDPKEDSLIVNEAPYFYYYDHMDPLAKEIYDLFLQLARDPVSEGNVQIMMTPVDPLSTEFQYAYARASLAVTFDHPELFWLYNTCREAQIQCSSEHRRVNGRYTIFFHMKQPYNDFTKKMTAFNQAAQDFLADIDRTKSQYEIVRQIHDKLIGQVTYDLAVCGSHTPDLAHTAYGALVANTGGAASTAVCDGYSLALEYLLQQCGIPAVFIGGYGGSSRENMGGHAWNIVSVDGQWYEVDSTWDDNQIDEAGFEEYRNESWYERQMEVIRDPVFRELLGHFLFLISTDSMEHYMPSGDVDWSFVFSDGMYAPDVSPGESFHERDGAHITAGQEAFDDPYGSVIFLAPTAGDNYL